MNRNLVAAFAAPAVALASIGASAAISLSDGAAYGKSAERLTAEALRANAEATFARADLDRSGALEAVEYTALALVTAELARLNGFVPVDYGEGVYTVSLNLSEPAGLTRAERVRVESVARSRFYAAAGQDGRMTGEQFVADQERRFTDADLNHDGVLSGKELVLYATREAMLPRQEA